ncbi:MAG: restriction endonuclease subunit S [Clostridiaceae bacterium]
MELIKLGNLYKITSGGTPSKNNSDYYENGKIPWIKTGDLKKQYIEECNDFITELGLNNSSAKIFPKGTVLIAMYGATIGATSILNIEASTNQACAAFIPNDKILPEYLYYFFIKNKNKIVELGVGGAQPNISATILKEIQFPLENLTIQTKVVNILNKARELIGKRKAQIEDLDKLVKSRFIEMFGDYLEQTDTTIKDIAKDTTVGIANSATHAYSDSGIVMLRNQNIRINYLDDRELIYISTEFAEKYKNKALKENDILVTRTGVNVGMACLVPKKYEGCQTFTTLILRLKDGIGVSPTYVCYYINSPLGKSFVDDNKIGVAQPNLGAKVLETMPIAIPSEKLQNEFSDFVKHVDKLKFEMEKSLKELENNFNSLMQKAFNGELFN